jgi:hypothetical protein
MSSLAAQGKERRSLRDVPIHLTGFNRLPTDYTSIHMLIYISEYKKAFCGSAWDRRPFWPGPEKGLAGGAARTNSRFIMPRAWDATGVDFKIE